MALSSLRSAVRHWMLCVGVVLAGVSVVSAADRKVFRFGDATNGGALIHDYADRWVEVGQTKETFYFEETSRTEDTIELLDRGRDVGLRIHADRGELRLMKSTVWHPWQLGKWIDAKELPAAMRIVPTDNKIRLAYLVPDDRQPIARYEERIRTVMAVVNDLYRTALRSQGYHFEELNFDKNAKGEPTVHLIKTKRTTRQYSEGDNEQIQHFVRVVEDLPLSLGSPRRHMIVVFAETYDLGPAPIEWANSVGRGAHFSTDGGVGIMSSWILRDEFCATNLDAQKKLLLDTTPIKGRTALGTRRPDSPRFEFIEDGFGAVAHELGHALGLPHDYRSPHDTMGHGFRNLQVNFLAKTPEDKRITFSRENARLLSVSRYLFADIDRTDNTPPQGQVEAQYVKGTPPTIKLAISASDDRGLRAVVLYDPQADTVAGGAELKDTEQTVNVQLPMISAKSGEFRIHTMLADGGGNLATVVSTVTVP